MSDAHVFMYSGDTEPKLLRPAKEGEDHIWIRPDGSTSKLVNGVWELWSPESELDA